MHKQIFWAPKAEIDLANNLDYLNKNWDEKVANQFMDLTEDLIVQISINPKQFPVIFKKEKIRKCVLTKHNTLFYRDSKSDVEILRIYDIRQDPVNLTFK